MTTSEKTMMVIRPSQVLNFPHFFVWIVIGLFLFVTNDELYGIPVYIVPIFLIGWRYLVIHSIRYEITTERIRFHRGVLNRKMDETELYRVRDYSIRRPFHLLIFHLATLHIDTKDVRHSTIDMIGIRNAEQVLTMLRKQVEASRTRKGVRDIDIGGYQ
ncbi:PH domain-containing protein (plasmid) [Providencia huaxiensis]|uniref:PH domain-containing protein n=3 Tax=Enterobacterales TaxID=91347 RepID=A0AA42FMZ1_9GAMM|nr:MULTISPECIES: PH domain-containing protein [Enterobacterales]ELB1214912.1 PH domain-containing protein [Proteus mirabilis]ELY4881552.1 PH domain-containing protein [Morganella morganii]HBC3733928.1 PH domain-containing protein [Escherichia coli]ELR5094353.1 PH domain-containing protein [Providencia rettgeri]ELR5243202.1 PH domain-containing protein [Providencia rettgeri]